MIAAAAALFVTVLWGLLPADVPPETTPPDESEAPREKAIFERYHKPFSGDLEAIRRRRFLRVLVSYNRTNYFFADGAFRGFEYELMKTYETFLNKGIKRKTDRTRVVFIPTPFNRLFRDLAEGRGDIAAAGITITPERREKASFTDPYITDVTEVVVLNGSVDTVAALEDLAGKTVYVLAGSSYAEHLRALNDGMFGAKEIRVTEMDKSLATEDILELVNADILEIAVADRHIADAWAEVLPNIVVREDLIVNAGGEIAWAVRKGCPNLMASLNDFIAKNKKGSLMGNMLFKRYYADSDWVRNPVKETERRKLKPLIPVIKKYADMYGFDWLAIAAQAYQESRLDQSKVSPRGAVGIMQILPSTAADPAVGIDDVRNLENNVHAGVKYLHYLMHKYFDGPEISPMAKVNFAWAAYNAGPRRIIKLRKRARAKGFDPNRWFGHVEKMAAETVGSEPVDYVAGINKYYIAYRLMIESAEQREKLREQHLQSSASE